MILETKDRCMSSVEILGKSRFLLLTDICCNLRVSVKNCVADSWLTYKKQILMSSNSNLLLEYFALCVGVLFPFLNRIPAVFLFKRFFGKDLTDESRTHKLQMQLRVCFIWNKNSSAELNQPKTYVPADINFLQLPAQPTNIISLSIAIPFKIFVFYGFGNLLFLISEERELSDFPLMLLHHVIEFVLLAGAELLGLQTLAVNILLLHLLTDITIDLMLLVHVADISYSTSGYPLTEVFYK
eukprot:snap_masked-scaffold_9-processed-gene-9.12-mRNA-1 protein AED:1.00 eAED:1.00 QI:0/0/0/0/1/1/3/0/240